MKPDLISPLEFIPPVIAHRGASAYAPENTLSAFVKAAQMGITWVEFDVMQTADGEPIIFHDDLLNRTTNGFGAVEKKLWNDLRQLDAGTWFHPQFSGERILSLSAILNFIKDMQLSANIEIKSQTKTHSDFIQRVIEEVENKISLTENRILFSSFSLENLYSLRQKKPDCLIGLLLDQWEPEWERHCALLQCVSIHVNHTILTQEKAAYIKNMGKKLLCYTVNDAKRAKELYSWGVDAVFSDKPDKII